MQSISTQQLLNTLQDRVFLFVIGLIFAGDLQDGGNSLVVLLYQVPDLVCHLQAQTCISVTCAMCRLIQLHSTYCLIDKHDANVTPGRKLFEGLHDDIQVLFRLWGQKLKGKQCFEKQNQVLKYGMNTLTIWVDDQEVGSLFSPLANAGQKKSSYGVLQMTTAIPQQHAERFRTNEQKSANQMSELTSSPMTAINPSFACLVSVMTREFQGWRCRRFNCRCRVAELKLIRLVKTYRFRRRPASTMFPVFSLLVRACATPCQSGLRLRSRLTCPLSTMRILGIESTCDESGAAIFELQTAGRPALVAHTVASQWKLHHAAQGNDLSLGGIQASLITLLCATRRHAHHRRTGT